MVFPWPWMNEQAIGTLLSYQFCKYLSWWISWGATYSSTTWRQNNWRKHLR